MNAPKNKNNAPAPESAIQRPKRRKQKLIRLNDLIPKQDVAGGHQLLFGATDATQTTNKPTNDWNGPPLAMQSNHVKFLQPLVRLLSSAVIIIVCSNCAEAPSYMQNLRAGVFPWQASQWGYWKGDGVHGSPKIVVYLSKQRAYFYKGKRVVGESTVSTGKPGFSTPPGHYHVVSKDRNHVSSEFGDYVDDSGKVVKSNVDSRYDSQPAGTHFDGARMPYCMHFNGGYAMHEGYVPRYAASHGCIRLPKGMAEHFFDASREGTPVIVEE